MKHKDIGDPREGIVFEVLIKNFPTGGKYKRGYVYFPKEWAGKRVKFQVIEVKGVE